MDDALAQFSSITGADADRAKFFVEAAGGDVTQAVSAFYESGGNDAADASVAGEAPVQEAPSSGPRTLSGAPAEPLPAGWGSSSARSGSASKSGGGFSAGGGRGGISTLRDLAGSSASSGAGRPGLGGIRRGQDSDDEDDGPPDLFAGGERSGLSVQDPNGARRRGQGSAPDVVGDILRQAAEASAQRGGDEQPTLPRTGGQTQSSFGGRGRTIGDSGDDNTETAGNTQSPTVGNDDGDEEEEDDDDEPVTRNLTFWSDGFSVEEGPLMRYDDPQHADTLAQINAGRAPLSLLGVRFGQRVELRVARRTEEKYTPPPPPPMRPFGGAGNRLGSPAATFTGIGSSVPGSSTATGSTTTAAQPSGTNAPSATSTLFQVDSSQPTTSLQIRLGDGQRLTGRFNHTHTVADVRAYINASSAGMAARSYVLQTSFPPKPIQDESATLKDANLLNAVVIQKLT
ncbi:SEP-domain-containing protein [Ceraceosorus guamensis]|uniref:SEP-domain-containing protein n=1 Tax=Ceraceosorus guamensis TaxID=1522189 RepID=A0A316VUX5_9BASI|nr:SEP-domain-containing protein [Ceraceosorus guamensis]PWN41232.1 SEP-domain-containing protein [Ceraceosorus guamensis]